MDRERLRSQKSALEAFLHEYSLSPSERDILTVRPILENGDESFFTVLKRANDIKERCTALMQDPYCMMTATLDLLEKISTDEENGYHRLFSWCQTECQLTGDKSYVLDGGNPHFLRLRQGLRTLKSKDTYYNHCVTEFVNNRRNLLTILLTENSGKWKQRNDETSNQMISDMFTWLHEYINEEKEGMRSLFLDPSSPETGNSNVLKSCLDVVFSGANKFVQEFLLPLFDDSSNILQLFECMQIIAFYENIVATTISPESSLRSTIASIEQSLWTRITSLLMYRIKHYFKLSPFVSGSFLPPTEKGEGFNSNSIFAECLLLLRQCFDVFSIHITDEM